jgi:phosphoribosylanthranilate isomerase
MTRAIQVKICGLSTPEAVRAAVEGGAGYVGFVFYPPSPRHVTAEQAALLVREVPAGIRKVGLFVDPSDEMLDHTLALVPLDILQLHGGESPERVAEIRRRSGLAVMKVLRIGDAADVAAAEPYQAVADILLFDAKPAADLKNALPGGNGLTFDWRHLAGRSWTRPWMLSGGLTADLLAEAVAATGAPGVDVSSGVETAPGVKDPALIRAFLAAAARLTTR